MRALLLGVLLAISVPVWVNAAVAFDTTTQVPPPIQPCEPAWKIDPAGGVIGTEN